MSKKPLKVNFRIYYIVAKLGKVYMDLEASTEEKAKKKLYSFYVKDAIKEITRVDILRS